MYVNMLKLFFGKYCISTSLGIKDYQNGVRCGKMLREATFDIRHCHSQRKQCDIGNIFVFLQRQKLTMLRQ